MFIPVFAVCLVLVVIMTGVVFVSEIDRSPGNYFAAFVSMFAWYVCMFLTINADGGTKIAFLITSWCAVAGVCFFLGRFIRAALRREETKNHQ